jgi:hypothetical protein
VSQTADHGYSRGAGTVAALLGIKGWGSKVSVAELSCSAKPSSSCTFCSSSSSSSSSWSAICCSLCCVALNQLLLALQCLRPLELLQTPNHNHLHCSPHRHRPRYCQWQHRHHRVLAKCSHRSGSPVGNSANDAAVSVAHAQTDCVALRIRQRGSSSGRKSRLLPPASPP